MQPSEVKLVLIHGFNIGDGGESTTGKLRPWAERYGFNDIHEFKYGKFDLWKVRWNSKKKAKELADIIGDKPTLVIAHSHGNVIADMAATEFHAPIVYHIGINAALSVNADFAPQVRRMDNWHTPGDRVLTAGKYYKWVTSPLAYLTKGKNYWGEAGKKGINITAENQDQVTNFNMQEPPSVKLPPIDDHSEFFQTRVLGHPQSQSNDIWGPEFFNMTLYKLEKLPSMSAIQAGFDVFSKSVKLYEKALESYKVTYGDIKNGNAFKLNFWSGGNKINNPAELISYWVEMGGRYQDGYFTV